MMSRFSLKVNGDALPLLRKDTMKKDDKKAFNTDTSGGHYAIPLKCILMCSKSSMICQMNAKAEIAEWWRGNIKQKHQKLLFAHH